MLEISPAKVAHVIVKAREYDAKVAAWEDESPSGESESESILEDFNNDATRSEVAQFIAGLNDDEQANLVALVWVGRGSYTADEFAEAVETAQAEKINKTEDYLLGTPLLADYLEEGLDKLGISVEDAEEDIL
jgi:hypothetical protein